MFTGVSSGYLSERQPHRDGEPVDRGDQESSAKRGPLHSTPQATKRQSDNRGQYVNNLHTSAKDTASGV